MPCGNLGRKYSRNIWENKKFVSKNLSTPTNYIGSDQVHQVNKQRKTKEALIDFANTTTKWYTPIKLNRPIILNSKQKPIEKTFPKLRNRNSEWKASKGQSRIVVSKKEDCINDAEVGVFSIPGSNNMLGSNNTDESLGSVGDMFSASSDGDNNTDMHLSLSSQC